MHFNLYSAMVSIIINMMCVFNNKTKFQELSVVSPPFCCACELIFHSNYYSYETIIHTSSLAADID